MQYTAIIKDGGLFIPNVFADLNNGDDGGTHIVQVTVDIAAVRQQLSTSTEPKQETPKTTAPKEIISKEIKKSVKKQPKKEAPKVAEDLDWGTQRKGAIGELEALNDSELSEIFKAYMNDGHAPTQISLENL